MMRTESCLRESKEQQARALLTQFPDATRGHLIEELGFDIASKILSGQVPTGTRLPSIRVLASETRLHRNTVALVYKQLSAMGLINTQPRRGIFVTDRVLDATRSEIGRRLVASAVARARACGMSARELSQLVHEIGGAESPYLRRLSR